MPNNFAIQIKFIIYTYSIFLFVYCENVAILKKTSSHPNKKKNKFKTRSSAWNKFQDSLPKKNKKISTIVKLSFFTTSSPFEIDETKQICGTYSLKVYMISQTNNPVII